MAELPSGTVTLLFTDIEGWTQLLRRLGDAYAAVLAAHQRLLRGAFGAWDGVAAVGERAGQLGVRPAPDAHRRWSMRPAASIRSSGIVP